MAKARVHILYEDILTSKKYFRIIVGRGKTATDACQDALTRITKLVYMSERFKMLEMKLEKLQ